jgi:23S rRNA (pseudouridine1915-N3)-methyltransferase
VRITLNAVGRMKQGPERELVARYLERARQSGKPLALTGFDILESADSRASSVAARKAEEAIALAAGFPEGAVVVALDERGKSLTSETLAATIAGWRDAGRPAAAFVIGGADGLAAELVARADLALGFSLLTWPHQLVRIMLAEQLYRVTTILSGHPYHRGNS